MKIYNWQQTDWPIFHYSLEQVEDDLLLFSEKVGRVSGILEALPDTSRTEVIIDIILTEAIKTSEIEGEYPNRTDVLSSIRKNLGIHSNVEYIKDKAAEGLGKLMIDVRKTFKEPLTEEVLFHWHTMLMTEAQKIEVGKWRTHDDPMVIVSGALGKQKIHFEAPPSKNIPSEMNRFLKWFNVLCPVNLCQSQFDLTNSSGDY
ncbi:MAG: DUF4172 domain-containing protein [Chitinophagaceae bacterium]|nr:DUF4172 domain-containing protein [Chitinophagaceae bacterium]